MNYLNPLFNFQKDLRAFNLKLKTKPLSITSRYTFVLILTALLIPLIEPTRAYSQTDDQSLVYLLFEEVPEVSVASKKEEKIMDVPASVSFFSAKDMNLFGYYSLYELANITAGYSSYTIYGEKVFETRGKKAGSWNNNKHLLFIDGIPVNHARAYKANTEEELPLYFADSVEILRGPSSALYGVSAFYGAISIIPKTLEENGTLFESKVSLGGNDSNRRIMTNIFNRTDEGNLNLSVGYFTKEASEKYTGPFDDLDNLYFDDQKSLFLYGSYEILSGPLNGFDPGIILMSKNSGMGEYWNGVHGGSSKINDLTWEQFIPYLKYKKKLGDHNTLKAYAKINQSTEKATVPPASWAPRPESYNYSDYESEVKSYEGSIELQTDILENCNIISGINFDTRSEELYLAGEKQASASGDVETQSYYIQSRANFFEDRTMLTLGARYDRGKAKKAGKAYNQTSPRACIVHKLSNNISLKASYGEAIRAPGIKEFGLNAEKQPFIGTKLPDLSPETIKTEEFSLIYYNSLVHLSLTAFKDKVESPLDGVNVLGIDGEVYNVVHNSSSYTDTKGYEFECRYRPLKLLGLLLNYSTAKALDENDNEFSDVPKSKLNAAISFYLDTPVRNTCSLIYRHVDSYRVSDGTRVSGYDMIDLNLVFDISETVALELQVKNLGNEKFKYPKSGIEDVPEAERYFTGSLNISF